VTAATLWVLVIAFTGAGPTLLQGSTVIRNYSSQAHCEAALVALLTSSSNEQFIVERGTCQPYQGD
jgi:hypothetical protein